MTYTVVGFMKGAGRRDNKIYEGRVNGMHNLWYSKDLRGKIFTHNLGN